MDQSLLIGTLPLCEKKQMHKFVKSWMLLTNRGPKARVRTRSVRNPRSAIKRSRSSVLRCNCLSSRTEIFIDLSFKEFQTFNYLYFRMVKCLCKITSLICGPECTSTAYNSV